MTGFVSLPPLTDGDDPAPPTPEVVSGDGWWPDIDLAALRQVQRIDTTITPERLREAVINAMIALAADLKAWRAVQTTAGYDNLAAVPAPEFGGRSRFVQLYERAIGDTAKADITERNRDMSATVAGVERQEELQAAAGDLRRSARYAIRQILGRPGITAEAL